MGHSKKSAKFDTIINVEANTNPSHITLPEPLYNVDYVQLEYFRLVDLPDAYFPPKFLYLELENTKTRPRFLANVIRHSTWNSTTHNPPTSSHYPLYFKPEFPYNGILVPGVYKAVHGKQNDLAYTIEDFGRLSDFTVKILGTDQRPITFDAETILQLVFRVFYTGKRNLDPSEQVKQYSRFQN